MRDPYVYPHTEILINKFNIKDKYLLNSLEADFTSSRLKDLILYGIPGNLNLELLLKFHYTIFQDIYYWAGQIRTINIEKPEPVLGGISIEYSTAENIEVDIISILSNLLKNNSDYVRNALVAASASFHDIGDKSSLEYLIAIITDAIERGKNV